MFIFTKRPACPALLAMIVIALFLPTLTRGQTNPIPESDQSGASQKDTETKKLHDKLAKYLTGTKWTGNFTMTGKEGMTAESYEIISAEKSEVGDFWNLIARIKYGGKDATLPLPPIEIKFAGTTPVITVDKVAFPGFGEFDARVVIRQGKYAGTWAHSGGVGGHLFGTIEKMTPEELKNKTTTGKGD